MDYSQDIFRSSYIYIYGEIEPLQSRPTNHHPHTYYYVYIHVYIYLEEGLVHLHVAQPDALIEAFLLLCLQVHKHQRVPLGVLQTAKQRVGLGHLP